MLNQIVLVGNLGADVEMRYSAEGNPVATFNLAFSSGRDKTGWIKAVAFGRLAEVCEEFLGKGSRVGIVGYLEQSRWEGTDGIIRSTYQLIANQVEFINTRKVEDSDADDSEDSSKGDAQENDGQENREGAPF